MANAYAQRYVNALIAKVAKDPNAVEIVGEVGVETARQPHVAVYLELGPGHFLGTTAGVSGRPMPLPVDRGLQYFELCALTTGHSPGVLKFLSDIAMYILATLSPSFYASDEELQRHVVAVAKAGGVAPPPKPFLPYETVQVTRDERLILVPRWSFFVPEGPPVEVVEPLPITEADWAALSVLSLDARAEWVRALGPAAPERWKALFPKL